MEISETIEVIKKLSTLQTIRGADGSVFSALSLSDDEEWHSDLLSWFFNPNGPLTNGWLLKLLFNHLGYKLPDGKPLVKRERQVDSARPDILIEWSDYKLLIENKTKSTENPDQCRKYLKTFKIGSKEDGILIFLSPSLKPWPRSISRSDNRVYGLSYRDLAMLMKQGLKKEKNKKAQVYISDYLMEVSKLTGELSIRKEAPEISESTRIINSSWPFIIDLRSQAAEECKAYIEWTISLALNEINELGIGHWNASCPFGSVFLFSRSDSDYGDHLLGVAYSPESKAVNKLISEYTHLVGVRMHANENSSFSPAEFRNTVREALYKKWNKEAVASLDLNPNASVTIRSNQSMWPVYKTVRFDDPESWEVWSKKLRNTIVGFVNAFNPAIVEVARSMKK